MDQTDPWQVVPRQDFTPYDCLLISIAFVVLSLGNHVSIYGKFFLSKMTPDM